MKLTPVLTEKSLKDARAGRFTFLVNKGQRKQTVKKIIGKTFNVHVRGVSSTNIKGGKKKNFRGKIQTAKAYKKVWVKLADKEKIDIFEEKIK